MFNGFTLTWTSPNSATDPLVNEYKYAIKILNDEHNEELEFTTSHPGTIQKLAHHTIT